MKQIEYDFCMRQFKPAIAVMAVLVVIIVGWTLWRVCPGSFVKPGASTAAAKQPMTPPIDVKAPMTHAYWGNCNKCHVTSGGGKPVSKVMAGAPITINQKQPHKYWGNCVQCHQVVDGFQADGSFVAPANAPNAPAKAAAFAGLTPQSVGLSLVPVNAAVAQKFSLAKDQGLLISEVAAGSVADKAGLLPGDLITRVEKTSVPTVADFQTALNDAAKPGEDLKFAIYRGRTGRNIIVSLPANLPDLLTAPVGQPIAQPVVAAPAPVAQAARPAEGLVALAASGPGLSAPVAPQFDTAPYFVLIDPIRQSFRVEQNPNAGTPGNGVPTGQLMANLGVSGVLSGGFSPQALATLSALGIAAYPGLTGGVQAAFDAFAAGRLQRAQTAQAGVVPSTPGRVQPQVGANVFPQTLY